MLNVSAFALMPEQTGGVDLDSRKYGQTDGVSSFKKEADEVSKTCILLFGQQELQS